MTPTGHSFLRTILLTSLALIAFASNSVLCRLALAPHLIEAGAFTSVRLMSGALTLVALLTLRDKRLPRLAVNWGSAFALFAYAIPFSFAYLRISTGTGALILFGAVQSTMIGMHLFEGNRLNMAEIAGLILAIGGLVMLTLPGVAAPDPIGAALMAAAGIAWGFYSLRGRGISDPLISTASNFLYAILFVVPIAMLQFETQTLSTKGVLLAIASGSLASGIGYAIWYTALRGLTASRAAIVQLLVPVLAAYGGVVFLNESISSRLVISGLIIFCGVVLAITVRNVRR